MSDRIEEGETVGGTRIELSCGHRLTLPWGLLPEVAAAEILHHRSECGPDPRIAFLGRATFPPNPYFPSAPARE